jgi:hypothetical protein
VLDQSVLATPADAGRGRASSDDDAVERHAARIKLQQSTLHAGA